ncbi:MAG: tetratricopeptide repeat protein [Candidatus Poribacteria bacterium]|nr:tetratricopeptide repeat protein [Candidatus Poribacteria bacterium]
MNIYAEEDRNPIRESAFALIDNGDFKRAAPKLESLLHTDMSRTDKLEIHHALGYTYEKLKNRPKAVGNYVRVITKEYPLAATAAFRLAKLYEEMKNDPKAIKWYTQLVNNYPKSVYQSEAKWNLAELHLNEKQYTHAKAILASILDHPTYARKAKYGLARCEEGLENYKEAFHIHQELIRHKQSDEVAEDAVGKLKMLANDHKSLKLTVGDKMNCGLVHYYQGNWKSAVNEFTPLTQSSDEKLKGRALYHLGLANQGRKWYNTATKNYNSVVTLGSKTDYLTRAHYQIAQCYRSKGSLTTAVNRLESFVKAYPWSEMVDNALYDIAQIHDKRNKTELALNAYSRLIEVEPGSPYADWAAWRIGWQRFDEKQYEKSYKAFEGLKDNFPGNRYAMGAHFWMAKIRERQNKPELAQEIYDEVAKARYWYYSARAKAILKITTSELEPKAVPDDKLIQHESCPEHLPTLMKLRLYEDGVYLLTHFIDKTPTAAKECYYALATCYEKLQRFDKAREVVDRALLSPSFANQSTDELAKIRKLLYPLHYEKYVEKYSEQYKVESALIYAMILEESRYRSDAISWAGAIGLMQIMPATGRELARQLNIQRFRTSMLKIPEINIRMGTKYIGYLNSKFDGNAMLVSGAYNGGPGRMSRWLASKKIKDIDEFVEKITIRETRLHIKKVINSYDNYIEIYGQTEIPAVNSALDEKNKQPETPILGKLNR